MFTRFAALIALALDNQMKRERDQSALRDERATSELREQFIAILGHDLRTPLQAVYATGELLERKLTDPALKGVATRIKTNVKRMSLLIDDVMDFARGRLGGGLGVRIAEVTDALSLPHVRERLAEMIETTETMRACLRAAEADAATDQWSVMVPARPPLDTARNLFPKLYPRMVEIIQLNSSSHLMATPSERDFASPMKSDLEKYYPAAGADAHERVALYRLAWDVAGSAFAGRQVLYERFFFGDPVRMASALVDNTDLKPLIERVNGFLARPD